VGYGTTSCFILNVCEVLRSLSKLIGTVFFYARPDLYFAILLDTND